MIMTNILANQLLENLMCVALSATGGVDLENINQKQMEFAEHYAKETFCDLLEAWEKSMGAKWKIEKD